jgi:hypothetical protein
LVLVVAPALTQPFPASGVFVSEEAVSALIAVMA